MPEQVPPLHVSTAVQYWPSSHEAVLFTWAQVSVASAHESFVHTFVSPQSRTVPEQVPPLHMSTAVQYWPSSHELPLVSAAVHVSLASSQDSAQLASPSAPGHAAEPT
ncbi:MAG: hypothetical protein HY826_05795 [Actinobacteria bacterium]|nr:hypothetical protein [Actinomycetota bacterium]